MRVLLILSLGFFMGCSILQGQADLIQGLSEKDSLMIQVKYLRSSGNLVTIIYKESDSLRLVTYTKNSSTFDNSLRYTKTFHVDLYENNEISTFLSRLQQSNFSNVKSENHSHFFASVYLNGKLLSRYFYGEEDIIIADDYFDLYYGGIKKVYPNDDKLFIDVVED